MIQRLAILALGSLALAHGGNATEKEAAVKQKIPMISPWDANQWEPGSDHSFWRAGTGKAKEAGAEAAKPSAKPIPSPTGTPAKPDFSNRQSEK